ncbi:MAG: MBL fold metallo-hydrolase [Spirochaetaceae bacterium]|nr:MAG: MBL fold metallo-hydrolase [Spirochaetaceae bacterium]
MTLTFLGAARNVTGSSTLLEAGGSRVLVDCGFVQEWKLRGRNWEPFAFDAKRLDAVVLTHAHLDHCGLLPRLVNAGFRGRIHCTAATAQLATIILLDSARIQEEDAQTKKRRHQAEGRSGKHPEVPLYTTDDAKAVIPLFKRESLGTAVEIADGVSATFREAGHIFGAASVLLECGSADGRRSVLFSGDVGRWDRPIIRDPDPFDRADYVVLESTYGDREHERDDIEELLAKEVNATHEAGGNLLIPSFALERAQEVLYYLNSLLRKDRIPHLVTFLDSPMALRTIEVFEQHPELFDDDMNALMRSGESPFKFPGLTLVSSVDESKSINHIRGTAIVIAGSGMCTGGRIKHHLAVNIDRPESTVLFVGYQAHGTLGRELVDGAKSVRLFGSTRNVRARISRINGFSGHADRTELVKWLSQMASPPQRVFLNHGETSAMQAFGDYLTDKTGLTTVMPEYRESFDLE